MPDAPLDEADFVKGKRELLVRTLERAGVVSALLTARRAVAMPWLTVLCYHRVGKPGTAGELDDGVLDATPEQFDRQLRVLREHFELVGAEDVIAYYRGAPLPRNPAMVSFDDGYLDNYTTALPILRKHGVRATFFIATHYVTARKLFWWDRLSLLIKRSRRDTLALTYPTVEQLPLGQQRPETLERLLGIVKKTAQLDLRHFLDEVANAADVSISAEEERALVDRFLMNWDQVRDLAQEGHDIGSHTRHHRILQTLDGDALRLELAGSRRDLEDATGRSIRSIAYPTGYPIGQRPDIAQALAEAGYEVGFTAHTGTSTTLVPPGRFDVKRISMDQDITEAYFRSFMALPPLARVRN